MQSFTAGQANTVYGNISAKANAEPIEVGTVYAYLRALSGAHAKKWWDGSAWSSEAVKAGDMTHVSSSQWEIDIAADAWIAGVRYRLDCLESGGLGIECSEEIVEISTPKEVSFEATISD